VKQQPIGFYGAFGIKKSGCIEEGGKNKLMIEKWGVMNKTSAPSDIHVFLKE